MKVVAILGGLGSQMFKYAFYLQIKEKDICYIDTTPYRLQRMWNGYELGKIFGIKEPDISELYTQDDIDELIQQGINYKGIGEKAIAGIDASKPIVSIFRGYLYPQRNRKILLFISLVYNKIKRLISKENDVQDKFPIIYRTNIFSIYFDEFNHTSDYYLGNGKDKEQLIQVFKFPAFQDERNIKIADYMKSTESVAMHIRRSDHMYDNEQLFTDNYFFKSVNHIKSRTETPVFFLFSDEPDWCRHNLDLLGFREEDKVEIVDWNKGSESYRDMQLMTYCQHNILAISSFSWWGYYLSKREEKIVCAPMGYWLEVPVHY